MRAGCLIGTSYSMFGLDVSFLARCLNMYRAPGYGFPSFRRGKGGFLTL